MGDETVETTLSWIIIGGLLILVGILTGNGVSRAASADLSGVYSRTSKTTRKDTMRKGTFLKSFDNSRVNSRVNALTCLLRAN
jgi:hypothetical protein